MLSVAITNRQKALPLDRALVRKLARAASPPGWGGAAVSLVFVDDGEIAALNRRFLGRNGPTDVLAFPMQGPDGSAIPLMGEVIICAERAVAQARRRGIPPARELALYVVHGMLHLGGYDDGTPAQRGRMRAREAEVLAAFRLRRAPDKRRSRAPRRNG